MKTVVFAILLACATAALGQAGGVLSNQPQMLQFPEHPERARVHTMAENQNLRGEESPYTYGRGERPLTEFASVSKAISLGDVARNYREEHASARKATIVWTN